MVTCRPIAAALVAVWFSLAQPAPATAGPPDGEPAITAPGVEGDYLRVVHGHIHEHWTKALSKPPAKPPARAAAPAPGAAEAVVLFSIRWDGTLAGISLITSSGAPAVDQMAVAAVRAAAPFGVPPLDIFSDDGVAHFRWSLAGDHRLCSGGHLQRKDDPLEEALPRLFFQGRVKEALLRVARQMGTAGDADVLGVFARSWLARPNTDPVADVAAAAALVRRNAGLQKSQPASQIDRLRAGLFNRETVAVAAIALHGVNADVCDAVRTRLVDGDADARELAVAALRHGEVSLPDGSPCARALGVIVADTKLPGRLRVAALNLLAASLGEAAHRLVADASKDPDPAVRGGAILISARPGGGRATLYRLTPLLRDPAIEVRAAAAAGLVRAGGDQFLDQLTPLLKERNPRMAAALAPELGRLGSERSAALLGGFLRTDDVDVRVAVVTALAGRETRGDQAARALLVPVLEAAKNDPRAPEALRSLALANASADELLALTAEPELAVRAFQSLLRAKRHKEASGLLIAQFDRFSAAQMARLLGAWLDDPPTPGAGVVRASGQDEKAQVK
ncbi:MAG TPA: TonB family protein [Polyangia bacterium]|jgi:TonB family protein|nr:TonB family protein [Polyangia bacterium]